MKKLLLILLVCSLSAFAFYLKNRFSSKDTYVRFFTPSDPSNIPVVEVKIQGKFYPCKINLDWGRSPLYLSKGFLSKIDKNLTGITTITVAGEEVKLPMYVFSKVEIGDSIFEKISVMEIPCKEGNELAYLGLKSSNKKICF